MFHFLYRATACHVTHGIAKAFLSICTPVSVCPSVKRVHCDKTKETCTHILTPQERTFILVFRREEWLVREATRLCAEILGQTDPVQATTPIFNRYSLLAPQPYSEKKFN